MVMVKQTPETSVFLDSKEKLIIIIKKYLPQGKIYLFGSRAQNKHSKGSDIDIALNIGQVVERDILAKIRSDVEASTIPYHVDIVDIYSVSSSMKQNILLEGKLWTD